MSTVFQGLWHGPPLSPLQRAALSSFIAHGYRFQLYSYGDPGAPPGVELLDAREVLAESSLFFFKNPQTSEPDLGPFSDLFRFRLLLDKGGWYVDVDTICLSPDIPAFTYAWARQNPEMNPDAVGTGQICFPPGDSVIRRLYETCRERAEAFDRREALGPHLITEVVRDARLPADMNGDVDLFYPIRWAEIFKLWLPEYLEEIETRVARSYFLPYYQSLPRYMGFLDDRLPPEGSYLRRICDRHERRDGARSLGAAEVREKVVAWFARNQPWAEREFRMTTGRNFTDAVELHVNNSARFVPEAGNADQPEKQNALPQPQLRATMTGGLDAVLANIDEAIVGLFRERERLVSSMAGTVRGTFSPFSTPFSLEARRQVRPFEELAPGFCIGFPADSNAVVYVSQDVQDDRYLSPPDHHFSLTVEIEEPGSASWVTVEMTAPPLEPEMPYRTTVALKAKASRESQVRFELSSPRPDGDDDRAQLGSVIVTRNFEAAMLSQAIPGFAAGSGRKGRDSKLIAFLPLAPGFKLTLAYCSIVTTKR